MTGGGTAEVPADLAVTPLLDGPVAVLDVRGELDLSGSPVLAAAMRAVPDDDLCVRLAGVTFLDSTGLRCLLEERARRASAGGRLEVRDPSERVTQVMRLAGVLDLLMPPS